MGVKKVVSGAAKKIVGTFGKRNEKEAVILGAEAIPNGCGFDSSEKDAKNTPKKNPTIVVG